MFIPTASNIARKPRPSDQKLEGRLVTIPMAPYLERIETYKAAFMPTPGLYDGLRHCTAYENAKTFYFGDGEAVQSMISRLGDRITSDIADRHYAVGSISASELTETPLLAPLYLDPNLRSPVFDPYQYGKQMYFGKVPIKVTMEKFIVDYVNAVVFENKKYAKDAASPEQILHETIDPVFVHRHVPQAEQVLLHSGWHIKPDARLHFFRMLETNMFSTMRDQIHRFLGTSPWEIVNVTRSGSYLVIERTEKDWRIKDWTEKFGHEYDCE